MKRVNEIFCSLQGEGYHTGRPAVFIRFSGCNLQCKFCDTRFDTFREMKDNEIVAETLRFATRFVVLTGGEPTLQVDKGLVDKLHEAGFYIAMESNGTRPVPQGIDWLTVSPKQNTVVTQCDELKVVYENVGSVKDYGIKADHYYLQPCDTGDVARNAEITQSCVEYILAHPQWRLSLQTHKLIGIR